MSKGQKASGPTQPQMDMSNKGAQMMSKMGFTHKVSDSSSISGKMMLAEAELEAGVNVGFREDGRLPEGSVESLGKLGEEARDESASNRLTTVGISAFDERSAFEMEGKVKGDTKHVV